MSLAAYPASLSEHNGLAGLQPSAWTLAAHQALRVLWAGGLWTLGVLVVPVLFQVLERQQAITGAVELFRTVGVVGFFLMAALFVVQTRVQLSKTAHWALGIAFAAACLLQFWVIPMLIENARAAEKEPIWHVFASALFVSQMACSACVALASTGQNHQLSAQDNPPNEEPTAEEPTAA